MEIFKGTKGNMNTTHRTDWTLSEVWGGSSCLRITSSSAPRLPRHPPFSFPPLYSWSWISAEKHRNKLFCSDWELPQVFEGGTFIVEFIVVAQATFHSPGCRLCGCSFRRGAKPRGWGWAACQTLAWLQKVQNDVCAGSGPMRVTAQRRLASMLGHSSLGNLGIRSLGSKWAGPSASKMSQTPKSDLLFI